MTDSPAPAEPEQPAQPRNFDGRVYYDDPAGWTPSRWSGLYMYMHKLNQYVGPTAGMLETPDAWASRIQSRRNGVRDDELQALDPARMHPDVRWFVKHMLIRQKRYDLALEKFPNLRPLRDAPAPDHVIVIFPDKPIPDPYLREHGIIA